MRTKNWIRTVTVAGVFLGLQLGISAEQFAFVGARASGMAGANAASTHDATAQWHNPAAFGFFGRSEWETNAVDNGNLSQQKFSSELLGIGAGFTMTEDMGRYLDILSDIDFNAFDQGELSSDGKNVESLLKVAGIVGTINSADALYADASTGLSMQMGHWGIGIRMFAEGAAYALPDRENLSLTSFLDTAALVSEIDAAAASDGFNGTGYTFSVLSPQQQADLGATLDVAATSDTVKYLDSKLGKLAAAGDLTGEEISAAIDIFNELLPGGGGISSNETAVVGRGFLMVEVPVSYGWALNENLSFGVTAKAMFGNVLGTQVWIFDENNDQVFNDLSDYTESSVALGLDLGALYRIPNFQFALVGHNLNRPKFSGFTDTVNLNGNPISFSIPDVKIDPQVTLGAAFMPSERLTLESNLDLLETGTLLDDYNIQRLSIGGEIDLRIMMLRLGTYKNIAASWQDWVATAGVGAKLAGVRVDVGGAYSLGNNVDYNGTEIPAEARLYASIGLDF